MDTPFWIYKPRILVDEYTDFFPSPQHRGYKLLNAITRFLIYVILGFILLKKKTTLPMTLLILTTVIGLIDSKKKKEICRKPTYNNPLMNPLLVNDDLNLSACKDVSTNEYLLEGVYDDSNKLYRNKNVLRTFITTPVSSYPNDSKAFAMALYDPGVGCKTRNNNCNTYSDLRFHR